jgi:cytochrome c-type biogenesis protein CcmH
MNPFWLFVAAFVLGAFIFVFFPLNKLNQPGARWLMLVAFLALPLVSIPLYQIFSNYDPAVAKSAAVGSVEEMVANLKTRLANEEGSAEDWFMLGRSYVAMNRFDEAVPIFAKVHEMTGGEDSGVMIAYAEALAMTDSGTLTRQGAELLDKALTINPTDTRGLWWGGVSALERGDHDLAAERWQKLLELDPAETLAQAVRERLSRIGFESHVASFDDQISIKVELGAGLAGQVNPNMILFIFARDVEGGGPPLAVARHMAGELPLTTSLGQANVMMASTVLSDYDRLKLVARVSRTGSPGSQPGDLFGEAEYRAGTDAVTLLIDQVVP